MPLLFGLIPFFKTCGPKTAIASIVAGLLTFVIVKNIGHQSLAVEVGLPTLMAAIVFVAGGLLSKTVPDKVSQLFLALKGDQESK
jgi:hypothetical protein